MLCDGSITRYVIVATEEMFKFHKFIFLTRHWNKPSRCVFTLFTLLVFLWIMLLQFEGITWIVSVRENYSPQTQLDATINKDDSLYTVVKTVKPAIAWKSMVLNILPSSSNNLTVGMSTFWGKATNELEIIALDIQHIGNDVYKAEFKPSFGGLYKVDIYLTYVNGKQFKYFARHVRSRMVNITGSPFRVLVQGRPHPENVTRYCSQSESGTARGRWVKCGSLRGIERCGRWQLNPTFDFDGYHNYFWLPYTCQLHYYSNNEMKTCLAKNGYERIVFTGDSHSRFRTYHWATRLYGTCKECGKNHMKTVFDHVPKMEWMFDARGTRWPATFPKSVRRPNEIYVNPKTRRSHFSYSFPNSTLNGDLYFMNFGHWLLRVMTFKKYMAEKVKAYLQGVKLMNSTRWNSKKRKRVSNLKGKQKRFIWVNSLSLTWREDKYVNMWTMTPSPSTIGYVNSILDPALKDAGIQVVDAFQISNPRLNASFDGTHYAKVFPDGVCAGVVENTVTNVILNALCNE